MKFLTIGLAHAKNRLSELVERVAKGEEITITRHDQPIAQLVPARRPGRGEATQAVEKIFNLRDRWQDRVAAAEIKEWKELGQP